jgi:mannose-1-phosphate guanylyltransferase
MTRVYAVIMAGGRGERFWPLSTDQLPKPFAPLLGSRTLIQETVARLEPLIPPEQVYVSIGVNHFGIAREQLPELPQQNFIIEPVGRDTSACLGFCALHLDVRDPDSTMLALPADHYIADPLKYRETLQLGIDSLKGSTAVVFGITPTRPEIGYGYVQTEDSSDPGRARKVLRFVEKPDIATAEKYVESGDYYWNSGIFLWRNRTLLDLFRKHMPRTHQGLEAMRPLLGRDDSKAEVHSIFSNLERISIDFGILEKADGLCLVPAEFDWDDIGNWSALERVLGKDAQSNTALGNHLALQSSDCILYSDAGTVAAFGVSGLVIVLAHGRVLVCPKDRAAELKRLVSAVGPERE